MPLKWERLMLTNKFSNWIYLSTMGLYLLSCSQLALAQSVKQLEEADKNGDGIIVWQEIVDMRLETFSRLDRNKDGFVDEKDVPSFGPMKNRLNIALEKLAKWDNNGDKRISKEEMLEAPAPLFETGDINSDGELSEDEIKRLREALH